MLPAWMPGPVVSGGYLEGSAVRLPEGGVGLLLRCRVYDGLGRLYDLQHACFFKLAPRPAAEAEAVAGRQTGQGPGLQATAAGAGGARLQTPDARRAAKQATTHHLHPRHADQEQQHQHQSGQQPAHLAGHHQQQHLHGPSASP